MEFNEKRKLLIIHGKHEKFYYDLDYLKELRHLSSSLAKSKIKLPVINIFLILRLTLGRQISFSYLY